MPEAGERVGLVFVSHSALIAEGLVELARQMAPTVTLVAAGGRDDGGIGTSYTRVMAALSEADTGGGVAVLCDLGSAVLIAETARDALPEERSSRVRIVDAPLVEGGVAAAVAAEGGASVDGVVLAARPVDSGSSAPSGAPAGTNETSPGFVRRVLITNDDGLHARPAAEFVKLANTFPTRATVNGKDAKSLLSLLSLGLNKGSWAEIKSLDPAGEVQVNALADLVESGFAAPVS